MGTVSAKVKAYKLEWQRRKRAERKALGLCQECGAVADCVGLMGFCARCGERRRERDRTQRAEAARVRAAKVAAERARPDAPFCPGCGLRDLMRGGKVKGRQRFRCRGCGRWSYGVAREEKLNLLPCPYCGGRCVRKGFSDEGRQRFLCTGCLRRNTGLVGDGRELEGAPFPRVVTLYLNFKAEYGLTNYCIEHNCSIRMALRRIFREAATMGANPMAIGKRVPDGWGGYKTVTWRPPARMPSSGELAALPGRLPDVRAEATRKFASQRGEAFQRLTVLVARKVAIALDDLAFAGLVWASRTWGVSHQEAARRLIARAGGW